MIEKEKELANEIYEIIKRASYGLSLKNSIIKDLKENITSILLIFRLDIINDCKNKDKENLAQMRNLLEVIRDREIERRNDNELPMLSDLILDLINKELKNV